MKLQNYLTGYIDKLPNGTYRFMVNGKSKGTYTTVAGLVLAHSPKAKTVRRSKPVSDES